MNFLPSMPKSRRTLETQCTIIAKVRDFSNVSIHNPRREPKSESIDYDVSCCYFAYHYPVTVYPNGHDDENEGYISVVFRQETFLRGWRFWHGKRFKLTGVISVVDAEGGLMFPRSFAVLGDFPKPDCNPTFVVDRYLSRRAPLDEELLGTDDILTLHMDMRLVETHYREPYSDDIVELAEFVNAFPSVYLVRTVDLPVYNLALASDIARKRLSPESFEYLRRMRVTPMVKRFLACYRRPPEVEEEHGDEEEKAEDLRMKSSSPFSFLEEEEREWIYRYFRDRHYGLLPSFIDILKQCLILDVVSSNVFLSSRFTDARNDARNDARLQSVCRRFADFYLEKIEKPRLLYKEHPKHVSVGSLVFGVATAVEVRSLDEILDLLVTADICRSSAPTLRDTCLRWLRLCLLQESFVCGSFTWEDYMNVLRTGDESLREILRVLMGSRCGARVIANWWRFGLTLKDTVNFSLFIFMERDSALNESLEGFLGGREEVGSGEEAWNDFRSLVGTPEEEKWTCEHVVSGSGYSSYSLLFRYRLDAADDCGSTENVEDDINSFNFYS